MDEQAFRRVAGARTLDLRVVKDRKRHREIGLVVHVDVADALVVLEDGDERRLAHRADQALAAARDRHIHVLRHPHERAHARVVRRLHKQHRVEEHGRMRRAAPAREPLLHGLGERPVRTQRLLPAAQDDCVRGLEAERRRVDEDVRTRLEDDGDDAQRFAHLHDVDAARAVALQQRLAHGVGQLRHEAHAVHHRAEARGREREPVHKRGRKARRARGRDILRIRGRDLRFGRLQRLRHGQQRSILVARLQRPQRARRGARPLPQVPDFLFNRHFSTLSLKGSNTNSATSHASASCAFRTSMNAAVAPSGAMSPFFGERFERRTP